MKRFDFIVQQMETALSGQFEEKVMSGGMVMSLRFKASRIQTQETIYYCRGLMEGYLGVPCYLSRFEPNNVVFWRQPGV